MQDEVRYHRVAEVPGLVLGVGRFAQFSFARHYHLDWHIGLVTEGVQRQCYEGRTEHVSPGRIALMPPGVIHDGVREGSHVCTLKTFRIPHELLHCIFEEFGQQHPLEGLRPAAIENHPLAHQFNLLHDAMQNPFAGPLAIQGKWLAILHGLFSEARAIAPAPSDAPLSAITWRTVRDYCMSRLGEKITLDELATLSKLERFRFLRQFKRTMGMTPHAWLLRMRLERACTLIAHGTGTLTGIAQEVGFFDQSHFTRAFRQAYGVSPSQY